MSISFKYNPWYGVYQYRSDSPAFEVDSPFYASGPVVSSAGLSGSLTSLSDGSSYLVAGSNVNITTGSSGAVTISSTAAGASASSILIFQPGGTPVSNVFTSWTDIMTELGNTYGQVIIEIDTTFGVATVPAGLHDFEKRVILQGIRGGFSFPPVLNLSDGAVLIDPNTIQDIELIHQATTEPNIRISNDGVVVMRRCYVTLSTGTQPFVRLDGSTAAFITLDEPSVILNSSMVPFADLLDTSYLSLGTTRGIIVNNNNLISGVAGTSFTLSNDSSLYVEGVPALPTNPNFLGDLYPFPLSNSALVTYDDTKLAGALLGTAFVQDAIDVLKNRWNSTTANSLFVTSSLAIRGNEASIDSPLDKGKDTFFYVSGSISSKNTLTSGAALFGGDVVISGSLCLASGSNLPTGMVFLDGASPGSAIVLNSLVSSNSMIFLTKQSFAQPNGLIAVSSKSPGSFTITSSHNGDNDSVAYMIINPS